MNCLLCNTDMERAERIDLRNFWEECPHCHSVALITTSSYDNYSVRATWLRTKPKELPNVDRIL